MSARYGRFSGLHRAKGFVDIVETTSPRDNRIEIERFLELAVGAPREVCPRHSGRIAHSREFGRRSGGNTPTITAPPRIARLFDRVPRCKKEKAAPEGEIRSRIARPKTRAEFEVWGTNL